MPGERPPSAHDQERQRLQTALRESEILRELAGLLASSLDLDQIIQVLVKRTTEVCSVGRCAVWLLEDSNQVLRPFVYALSSQQALNDKLIRTADHMWYRNILSTADPLMSRVLEGKGILYLEDLRDEPTMRSIAETFLVRSILLVALVREGRTVGMMSLDDPGEARAFPAEQQQLVLAIGQQAAMAIDNAQLYRQAQQERQRAELLIERSQAIYQVAMSVNSDEELPAIFEVALQHLIPGLNADNGMILLLEAGRLRPGHRLPKQAEPLEPALLEELPFCRQVAGSGIPQFVSARRLGVAELLWFHKLGLENALIVPLQVGMLRKNGHGSRRCVGLILANYHDASQRPDQGHFTFAQDIAAQCALAIEKTRLFHHANQAAILATERASTLNAIFDTMREGITVFNQQGQLLMRNAAAVEFMGEALQNLDMMVEILQRHPASTLQGQQITFEEFPLTRALQGEQIRGERIVVQRSDGAERVVEINVGPLLNAEQEQIGIVSAFRDITTQVRLEQHIHQALETMLSLAEALSGQTDIQEILHSVLATSLSALNCTHGLVTLYDEELQSFVPLLSLDLSASPETSAQKPWIEAGSWLISELQRRKDFQTQFTQGHAILITPEQHSHFRRQSRQPRSQATSHKVLSLVAPIAHNNRLRGVILLERRLAIEYNVANPLPEQQRYDFTIWDMAVIEGITQLAGLAIEQTHWQQEALAAQTRESAMREANALKDEFLAITAHEFRTPLTLILAHSQVALRSLRRNPEEIKRERLSENLSMIEEQTRHLTNIVNTFLEATQINRGQLFLNLEPVDLERVLQQVIANYKTPATQHRIASQIVPSKQAYLVRGDSARLQQVIANLIQNALKYSQQGEPVMLVLRRLSPEGAPETIEVAVRDQGIGIPKEDQAHLFERFYRAPNIQMSKARGIGLGLYVVAEILRLHGGEIRVESSGIPGEGSCFIFSLPALESPKLPNV